MGGGQKINIYFFFWGGEGGRGGGRTNARPGTDQMTSGPRKKLHPMAQTDIKTDMATL